jgi:hypothetical protein
MRDDGGRGAGVADTLWRNGRLRRLKWVSHWRSPELLHNGNRMATQTAVGMA